MDGQVTGQRRPSSNLSLFAILLATIAAGVWAYVWYQPAPAVTQVALAPSPSPSSDLFSQPTPAPTATPTPTAAPARRSPQARRAESATPAPSPTVVAPPPANPVPAKVAPPSRPAPTPTPASPQAPAPDPNSPIFEAGATGVAPPALLTPLANARTRPDANYEPGSASIEVIVAEDGGVSSVKAARQPETIGETLQMVNWLSITKSWRFTPAVRNGKPVRYRLIVPLSALVTGRSR